MSLVIAPCSHEAAKHAVINWHYSKAMPSGKLIKYGVWEDEKFIGVVLYGRGANSHLGKPYNLDQTEICELVRVALYKHKTTVSQIVAKTLSMLKESNPLIRLVVSFADTEQNHKGGIYQAGNWIYLGKSLPADEYWVNGKRYHGRSLRAVRNGHKLKNDGSVNVLEWAKKHLDPNAKMIFGSSKHRYVYPLDKSMRRKVTKLSLPYPSAVEGSMASRGNSVIEGKVQTLPTAPTVNSK